MTAGRPYRRRYRLFRVPAALAWGQPAWCVAMYLGPHVVELHRVSTWDDGLALTHELIAGDVRLELARQSLAPTTETSTP